MTYSPASPIFARPTLTPAAFAAYLRARRSPALIEASAIYTVLTGAGIDPAIALGQFAAESTYGSKGYASRTHNWGNIAMATPGTGRKLPRVTRAAYRAAVIRTHWSRRFGARPYSPGNGYTYAAFPTWRDGARAYAALMRTYRLRRWTTSVALMASHWLGMRDATRSGYVANIVREAARATGPRRTPAAAWPAPKPTPPTPPAITEEPDMAIDLSTPSGDTPTLLRQWLAVYKGARSPAFDPADAASRIVQLTANIVAHGTAYSARGSVTPSLLRLARKLNRGNAFALTEPFAASLASGEPEFARSIGVASESLVAATGPKAG